MTPNLNPNPNPNPNPNLNPNLNLNLNLPRIGGLRLGLRLREIKA
jgi:hypothetical protein